MIKECILAKPGILFDDNRLQSLGMNPKEPERNEDFDEVVNQGYSEDGVSQSGSAMSSLENRDFADVFSRIYNQLSIKPFWWILELLPSLIASQLGNGSWLHVRR